MKTKFFSLLAGASLFALASAAHAAQPLTDNQMDRVTAGFAALSEATVFGLADFASTGFTQTTSESDFVNRVAAASAQSTQLSISVAFQAFAASHAASAASNLP